MFLVSVMSMQPGAWVMAKGGLLFMTMDWGVTPQAQNTGTSPSRISTVAELGMHDVTHADGIRIADVDRGAVHLRMAPEICTAFTTWS